MKALRYIILVWIIVWILMIFTLIFMKNYEGLNVVLVIGAIGLFTMLWLGYGKIRDIMSSEST